MAATVPQGGRAGAAGDLPATRLHAGGSLRIRDRGAPAQGGRVGAAGDLPAGEEVAGRRQHDALEHNRGRAQRRGCSAHGRHLQRDLRARRAHGVLRARHCRTRQRGAMRGAALADGPAACTCWARSALSRACAQCANRARSWPCPTGSLGPPCTTPGALQQPRRRCRTARGCCRPPRPGAGAAGRARRAATRGRAWRAAARGPAATGRRAAAAAPAAA